MRTRGRSTARTESHETYRVTRINQELRQNYRAGGEGTYENNRTEGARLTAISKKLSMARRHIKDYYRHKDGFVAIEDIANFPQRRESAHLEATITDAEEIVNGEGRNSKLRFEWGVMSDGRLALRTPQCHIEGSGVTSDYLRQIPNLGPIAHATSVANAYNICQEGIRRAGSLHILLGRLIRQRPVGIRGGSEAAVAAGGERCVGDGIVFYESANNVTIAEGVGGVIPWSYLSQVFNCRAGKILYTPPGGWLKDSPINGRSQSSSATWP